MKCGVKDSDLKGAEAQFATKTEGYANGLRSMTLEL